MLVLGGNRSGKTLLGAIKVVKLLLEKENAEGWAATWSDLLVPVLMKKYFLVIPKSEIAYGEFNEQRGFKNRIIIFKNGSVLRFKTYEQGWESFQGSSKDVIHLDEEAPVEIYRECLMRLVDKRGVMIRTMTPVNGLTYTYEEVINSKDEEFEYWYWDTRYNKHLPQDELKRIIETYPEKEKEVRLTGKFMNLTSGLAYYNFSMVDNVISSYEYNNLVPLEIGCDFNVELMSWTISQNVDGKDIVFDLIELENYANTQLMCDILKERYPDHKGGLIFYLDFSANQRRPEASYSNYDIVKNNFPNSLIRTSAVKNIKDRVDIVNLRLKDNYGNRNLLVVEKCKRLINDFQRVTWEMLLNKNKAGLLTHCSDGISYVMYNKYFIGDRKIKTQLSY